MQGPWYLGLGGEPEAGLGFTSRAAAEIPLTMCVPPCENHGETVGKQDTNIDL